MKKGGQIYGSLFRYLLIGLIAVMIILFGINAVNRVKTASCRTSLILLENNLKESVKNIYSDVGSVNEGDFKIPCNVDQVYFVDLERNMSRLFKSLYEYPLIKDAIKDNVEKNAFLVKNNKVVNSFYLGNIELQKPYFICSDTTRRNLALYLGGTGSSTEIVNKECALDCTFEVVDIDEETARKLLNDSIKKAKEHDVNGFPTGDNFTELMNNFRETNQAVRIARRCNCGRKPGTTVVEILIKPEGSVEHFKLIETIPKDFVDYLYDYLENMSGDYDYFKIISDPLIMWHFNEISTETIVKYTIDKDILEYCADAFKIVGVGVTVESENVSDEELLDEYVNSPLTFVLPAGDVEIKEDHTDMNVFNRNKGGQIWKFASDNDIWNQNDFKAYTYKISIDDDTQYSDEANYAPPSPVSGDDYINCEIDQTPESKKVRCSVGSDFSETSHKFFIKVTGPDESAVDSFTVTLLDCGNFNEKEECKSHSSDCEWCPKCDGNKWSRNQDDMCVNKKECSYEIATDGDGDGYNVECDNDCDDNNPNINLSSTNPYCDCNPTTKGITAGTDEKDQLCYDAIDNNCNGEVDNCIRLECTRQVETYRLPGSPPGCVHEFGDECIDNGWRGWITGDCNCFLWWCDDTFVCYEDWETDCMENPQCIGGEKHPDFPDPIVCALTCTNNDGDGYSIEGGSCGEIDCDDDNEDINPGATETCNNVDDDCDGEIDEDLTQTTTCGLGACSGNTGEETCTAGAWGGDTCEPYAGAGEETCNNVDDDCDGDVDEDFIDLGDECSVGVGECQAAGNYICTIDGSGTECDAVAGTQTQELCDGLDNDCDDLTDEDLTRTTTCGVGECAGSTGEETCTAGTWGDDTCDPYEGASDEECDDGEDNDCDGDTDCDDDDCDDDDECVECVDNDDCSEGYVCDDGECVASGPGGDI